MKLPDVVTTLVDQERGVIYEVVAYRRLTKQELITSVRYHLSRLKKKPKRGDVFRILIAIS